MDTYRGYHCGEFSIRGVDVEFLQDTLKVADSHLSIYGIVVKESYAATVLARRVLEQRLQ